MRLSAGLASKLCLISLALPRNSIVGVVAAFSTQNGNIISGPRALTFVGGGSTAGSSITSSHHLPVVNAWSHSKKKNTYNNGNRVTSSRLYSSSSEGDVVLMNIGKEAMEKILEDYEEGGREESGYVVMDVREQHEIAVTGKLSPNTITFPLQSLMRYNAFALDEDEFEEIFDFEKPKLDETLVFSCAAGVRSVAAAQFAAQNGYTQLVNYQGGSKEWFNY